jgi:hypothetical protein
MKLSVKLTLLTTAALSLAALSSQSIAQDGNGSELIIENFVGTINWENAAGDIRVKSRKNMGQTVLDDRDSDLLIDGKHDTLEGTSCKGYYGSYDISLFGGKKRKGKFGGYEDLEDFPVLDITIPQNTTIVIRDSILFSAGQPNVYAADLSLQHCGKIELGDVATRVDLESNGSADLKLGRVDSLDSEMSGSGDIEGEFARNLSVEGRGSGDIEFDEVETLNVELRGSGDVEVDMATRVSIEASGSGDFGFDTIYEVLDFKGSGSGDLSVDDFIGKGESVVQIQTRGSGDVSVDEGSIRDLYVRASGSSDVDIDADIIDADVEASGSSDIHLNKVSGNLIQKERGSANIHIN